MSLALSGKHQSNPEKPQNSCDPQRFHHFCQHPLRAGRCDQDSFTTSLLVLGNVPYSSLLLLTSGVFAL